MTFAKSSHLQSDLLWHTLSLIGEYHGVTVAAAFLASVLPQLKFLQDTEINQITLDVTSNCCNN